MYLNLYFKPHWLNVFDLDSEIVFMNIISPNTIRDYIFDNFGNVGKLSANNVEFVMPSIFVANDWKCHFSVNTQTGLWQDFKTGRSGNFIHLFAEVENLSYKKALSKLLFKDLMEEVSGEKEAKIEPVIRKITDFPNFLEEGLVVSADSDTESNDLLEKAWMLLYDRGLFNLEDDETEPFYVATSGRYKGRLIIPFKDPEGALFFFQARALGDEQPKYLNPLDSPVKPSHILYPFDEAAASVVVCEGPLDARSLQLQGINATCTLGSSISDTQISALSRFHGKVIVGYDNDSAGDRGLRKFESLRLEKRMTKLHVCPPPRGYKDWNSAHAQGYDLKDWLKTETCRYDFNYKLSTLL